MRENDFFTRMVKVTMIGAGVIVFTSCEKEQMPMSGISADPTASQILVTSGVQHEYTLGGLDDPAMARASNGMTVSFNGTGIFNEKKKSITGGGDYYSDDPSIGAGTWAVKQLSTFENYGSSAGSTNIGGRLVTAITLTSNNGSIHQAVLQMADCSGNAPSSCVEGIRLDVKGGLNFNTEISGPVIFD